MNNLLDLRELDSDFFAVLDAEDELGAVVRAHIHIESCLNALVEGWMVSPSHLAKMQLDYAQKVELAVALGLKEQYSAPLRALGTLRNAFAHRPGTAITKDRADSIYKSLHQDDKNLVQAVYARICAKATDERPKFKELKARDRFTLVAVAMRAMLISALHNQAGGTPPTIEPSSPVSTFDVER